MSLGTELCLMLSSEHVYNKHSCWRCRVFNLTSKRAYIHG